MKSATICETETDSNFLQRNVTSIINTLNTSPTKDDYSVTYCDIFWTAISILCRIVNIILTLNLAYDYYGNDKINYFIWTIFCFVIPMVVTSFIQIYMYLQDLKSNNTTRKRDGYIDILCFVIVLPFLFRYCQSLSYAIAGKMAEKRNNKIEQKKYYELLIHEDSDVALIRIFECFLEAAPQKVLQISIILSGEDNINVPQILSIVGSLVSMAWCIASYHRCIRFSQADKINISLLGTVIQWLWHFLISVSRVTSIAIIASIFPKWTLIGCSVHAILMSLWLFWVDRSPFCSNTLCHSFSFSLVLGIVFIFNYIIPKVGKTRYRYTLFYFVCFFENISCIILYYYYSNDINREANYFVPLCLLGIIPFLIGLIFMIIYYTKFHPNIVIHRHDQIQTIAN